jgi:hypothetical protein
VHAANPLAENLDPVRRMLVIAEDVADVEIRADFGRADGIDKRRKLQR